MRVLLVALLLTLSPPGSATGQEIACIPTTDLGCDDRNPCTEDRCVGIACAHTPESGPSCDDRDPCTEQDRCESGRCVGAPVVCPDDGVSCTDDVCVQGRCAHLPIDSRCVPDDRCTSAVCAPGTGCVVGASRSEAEECAEDGDACTTDVCGGGRCRHDELPDTAACSAAQPAFRRALAFASEARALGARLGPDAPPFLLERVRGIADAFVDAARALAGKSATHPPRSAPLAETPLQLRARLALSILRRTRPQIGAFVRATRARSDIGARTAVDVGRRGRELLRATRILRAELRRLLRVRASFAR